MGRQIHEILTTNFFFLPSPLDQLFPSFMHMKHMNIKHMLDFHSPDGNLGHKLLTFRCENDLPRSGTQPPVTRQYVVGAAQKLQLPNGFDWQR